MRDALVAIGVPPARIAVEAVSSTTHHEAVLIAPMLRDLHVDHLVLVMTAARPSSRLVMRRFPA